MTYTVQKVAKLSGVSVRTLHYYDEIGLLKPAYCGANGYRYYEEEQLLRLQQILFFRELGMELKKIGEILDRNDFSQIGALTSHRRVLQREVKRLEGLIATIGKTIKHMKGEKSMEPWEFYANFGKKKQQEYEQYLIDRYGKKAKSRLEESKRNTAKWTKEDWAEIKQGGEKLNREFAHAIDGGLKPESEEVQKLVEQHCNWIGRFYTVTKEVYVGLGELYNEHPDFRKHYEPFHPQLPKFLGRAMAVYAERELN